jgi:hypothetical protein
LGEGIDKFVAANSSKEFGATFLRDRTKDLAHIISVSHVVSHLIVIHCTCKLITFVNSSMGGLNNAVEGSKVLTLQLGGGCQPWSYLNGGGVNPKVKRLSLFSSRKCYTQIQGNNRVLLFESRAVGVHLTPPHPFTERLCVQSLTISTGSNQTT